MFKPFIKDFREKMERFIPSSERPKLNENEIIDYVQAFSAYLCKKDGAYCYNYSFLVQQNREFLEFLEKADVKRTALIEFIDRLNQIEKLKALSGTGGSANSMEVSMNDLWKIDAESGECSLIDDFSVSGAVCGSSSDMITLRYKGRASTLSPDIDQKYLEQIVEILLDTAAEREDNNDNNDNNEKSEDNHPGSTSFQ